MDNYDKSIFLNCPFDEEYLDIFYAILFCIADCGFIARCALEADDSGEVRIEKILKIIGGCKFGIHDISRTEPCQKTKLPRFNMPLELGLFLGAKQFGNAKQKKKICLILENKKYLYQVYLSDFSGQDTKAHTNNPLSAISLVSEWLRNSTQNKGISGGKEIAKRYRVFQDALPDLLDSAKIAREEMSFSDYSQFLYAWLESTKF